MARKKKVKEEKARKTVKNAMMTEGIDYSQVGDRKRSLRSDAKFDPFEAYRLKRAKLSCERIAEIYGVSMEAVRKAIKRVSGMSYAGVVSNDEIYEDIKEKRLELLNSKHMMAIEAITPEKLELESARDNALTTKALYEQIRLENNQSTQNVNVQTFAQVVKGSDETIGL